MKKSAKKTQSTKKSSKSLQIIILSGESSPERAIFGLSYALTAATMEYEVFLFLAMDGARLVSADLSNRTIINDYESIPDYIKLLRELNVRIGVCSTCVTELCKPKKQPLNFNVPNSFTLPKVLLEGVEVVGMTALFSSEYCQTVVF